MQTDKLPSGVYNVTITDKEHIATKKLVKIK
ncbi:MAG: hypothetical protein IPN87_03710 [Saprospiraceae bacterium]|nr:hypothetical protein [Candidatus Brachybacter algidus]